MCDAEKTSVEHVPPRCLFPKQSDLSFGINLRKQLITVPSCHVHNTAKSHDDEYLMYALVMNVPNNTTAKNQFRTKIMRAISQSPGIIQSLVRYQVPVKVENTTTGLVEDTVAFRVDKQRIYDSLEHIGRALYFHHFKAKWVSSVEVYPHFLLSLDGKDSRSFNGNVSDMQAYVEDYLRGEPQNGVNPEVFSYQVARSGNSLPVVMLLTFYEGSKATLFLKDG